MHISIYFNTLWALTTRGFKGIVILILICSLILPHQSTATEKLIIKLTSPKNITQFSQKLEKLGVTQVNPINLPRKKDLKNAQFLLTPPPQSIVIELTANDDLDTVIQTLNQHDNIAYVEPVYPITLFSTSESPSPPNDPLYNKQAYMARLELTQLHHLPIIEPVIVAIIDSGIDHRHQDLSAMIHYNRNEIPDNGIDDDNNGYRDDFFGYNFYGESEGKGTPNSHDEEGHGTHIAGIIAAQSNNGHGMSGLTHGARLLPIRFLDAQGNGNQVDAAIAIRYAVDQGARIINCSWGFFNVNTVLREAIQYAIDHHVIVVAAVGNSDTLIPEFPAGLPGVITVGSVGQSQKRSYFSSYGPHLDFMYIGQNILGTTPGNTYDYKSGTSQSTAFVTGIIASLLAAEPDLTPDDIYDRLKQATSQSEKSKKMGYGMIDISKLISNLDIQLESVPVMRSRSNTLSVTDVLNYPNPIRSEGTTFGFTSTEHGANVQIRIYTPDGQKVHEIAAVTVTGYNNHIQWHPTSIKNGTYLYHLEISGQTGTFSKTGKCTVLQ